jgi:hypothetical protein
MFHIKQAVVQKTVSVLEHAAFIVLMQRIFNKVQQRSLIRNMIFSVWVRSLISDIKGVT